MDPIAVPPDEDALPGIDELFIRSWRAFADGWRPLVGLWLAGLWRSLAALVPPGILTALVFVGFGDSLSQGAVAALFTAIWLGPVLYLLYVWMLIQLAMYEAAREPGADRTARERMAEAKPSFWPLAWMLTIMSVAVPLAFVLLILPGVALVVYWSVAIPALALERLSARRALRRSRDLVRGRWWPVFARVAVFLAATGLAASPVFLLRYLGWEAASFGLEFVVRVFFFLWSIHFTLELYDELREREDGAPAHSATSASPSPRRRFSRPRPAPRNGRSRSARAPAADSTRRTWR